MSHFSIYSRLPLFRASVAPADDADERRSIHLLVKLDERTAGITLTTVFSACLISGTHHVIRHSKRAAPGFDEGQFDAHQAVRIFVGERVDVADAEATDEDVTALFVLVGGGRETRRLHERVELKRLVDGQNGQIILEGYLRAATLILAAIVLVHLETLDRSRLK